ncbi:MAG: right-handed parallel beta-helix repeat-containing protein, partial [Planctomycetota bacterium]|nr:right-handed parallel beta-helix repeat-containing protein [Planctomycetota bacterium]
DANDGLTPGTPLRTIEAGKDLMRDGMPDWLLLKRGTVFYDRIGSWDKSGRSASEPMIITGYGSNSARPRLLTGNETGIGIFSGDHVNNFVISGIHFEAHTYDGISNHIVGLLVLETGSNHLYEDCVFKNYTDNIVLQAGGVGLRNVVIRRTLVLDAFRVGVPWGKSQGMFASGVHGLLIEECIFDHNGWSEEHPSAPANIFSHNIYISNTCSDVVVRRSILTEASSHGLQLRPGGVITDNLVVRNPIGILAGGGDSPNSGGVTATVTGNIVLEGVDIGPGYPRGFGIDLKNLKSALVADNIVANKISATGGFFSIGKSVSGGPEGIGVRNTTIENNIIHNWRSPVYFNNNCLNVVVRNNVIQDPAIPDSRGLTNTYTTNPAEVSFSSNTYHSDTTDDEWFHIDWQAMPTQQWRTDFESSLELREIQFDEPSRSMGTYAGSLGLTATHDALMAQVRTQSRSNWRTEYSIDVLLTYFRNGFKESSP